MPNLLLDQITSIRLSPTSLVLSFSCRCTRTHFAGGDGDNAQMHRVIERSGGEPGQERAGSSSGNRACLTRCRPPLARLDWPPPRRAQVHWSDTARVHRHRPSVRTDEANDVKRDGGSELQIRSVPGRPASNLCTSSFSRLPCF